MQAFFCAVAKKFPEIKFLQERKKHLAKGPAFCYDK